jgi:phosphatidylglycerol---prolipoprotein diacylglyceryl transferase
MMRFGSMVSSLAAIGWHVLDRFRFGSRVAISPHGLGIAVGYLCGATIFIREARKRGYPEEDSGRIMFWALIGTIVGARVAYVITHFSQFHSVVDVFAIYRGGISLIGGIVGAMIASYFIVRRARLRFVPGLDASAMPIAIGIVIGRIGDLIIGDHLGRPTSWLLAFQYHGGNLSGYDCTTSTGACFITLSGGHAQTITRHGATLVSSTGRVLGTGVGVHQTALYDLFIAMGLVLLLVSLNRVPRRTGVLIATFGLWYGTGRIVTDFLRVENRFLGLTGSQWSSCVAVAACLFILIRFALRPVGPGSPEPALAEGARSTPT